MDYQRAQSDLQAANQRIASLESSLRQAESMARNVPSRMPSLVAPPPVPVSPSAATLSNAQIAELNNLRDQNLRLQNQLKGMSQSSPLPGREQIDRKISALNQQNLTAQIQLDQERARVEDLRKQLSEARDIKQEVLERGQSANLKVGLLNEELTEARQRISSLENALVAAREAIRVLKNANDGSAIKVSVPLSPSPVSVPSNRRNTFSPSPPTPRSSFPVAPPVRPQRLLFEAVALWAGSFPVTPKPLLSLSLFPRVTRLLACVPRSNFSTTRTVLPASPNSFCCKRTWIRFSSHPASAFPADRASIPLPSFGLVRFNGDIVTLALRRLFAIPWPLPVLPESRRIPSGRLI